MAANDQCMWRCGYLKYKIVPHDKAFFFKTKLRIYTAPAMAHTFC
jgi:hypothetical protein